jgi:alkylation response protein AidB-like acyl-CoA dehydrogenase
MVPGIGCVGGRLDFVQNDTQRMIADMLGRLLRERNEFAARRERLMQNPPRRLHLWQNFVESGLLAALLPEANGGMGGSGRDIAVMAYEIGRSLAVEPLFGLLTSSRILIASDTDAARARLDTGIAGDMRIIFAHEEGHDPFSPPSVRAIPDGDAYRLSGVKPVVVHADVADAFIVTATLPDGSPGCFLLDADGAGVVREAFRMIDASGAGTLTLSDAPGALLLAGEAARVAILDAIEWTILALAAEAVGIMDSLNGLTRDYLRTRVQFGVPIGSFQALQHRSADIFIAGEEAGIAVDAVATALDGPVSDLRSARVAALKAVVDKAGRKVGHNAVQLHGGVGVSDELIVSHYMRRLAAISARLGSADLHSSRFQALTA